MFWPLLILFNVYFAVGVKGFLPVRLQFGFTPLYSRDESLDKYADDKDSAGNPYNKAYKSGIVNLGLMVPLYQDNRLFLGFDLEGNFEILQVGTNESKFVPSGYWLGLGGGFLWNQHVINRIFVFVNKSVLVKDELSSLNNMGLFLDTFVLPGFYLSFLGVMNSIFFSDTKNMREPYFDILAKFRLPLEKDFSLVNIRDTFIIAGFNGNFRIGLEGRFFDSALGFKLCLGVYKIFLSLEFDIRGTTKHLKNSLINRSFLDHIPLPILLQKK